MSAVYTTDEYGRPVIIVRESQKKARMSGTEAIKVCVGAMNLRLLRCAPSLDIPPPTRHDMN